MLFAWLPMSPQPKPMMLPFMEDPQRRRRERGHSDADRRRRRMASVVRPYNPESPVRRRRSGAHRPAEEESDSASSSLTSDEQHRGRPSAAPALPPSPAPERRRSKPRYHRLRHRKQREGFSPVAERPSSQKRAHSRQQPPQRDHGRDSRRNAGAPPSGRKRRREDSRSHSPESSQTLEPPPPPPPGWDDERDDIHDQDASSSAPQHAGASGSDRRPEPAREYWPKRRVPGGGWEKRRRWRAIQHQERIAAGQFPDRNRPTGAQLVGQACRGCSGRQHHALGCPRLLCGDCCRKHPAGPCGDHRKGRVPPPSGATAA